MSNPVCNKGLFRAAAKAPANEEGFALVTTMVLTALLALLGFAVISSTIVELQVATNDRDYKRNFYRAEGAAMETAQILENEKDAEELRPSTSAKNWLRGPGVDYTDPSAWTATNYRIAALDDATNDVRQAALGLGVAKGNKGSSLGMSGTKVQEFRLFGRSEERNGRVIIEIGYKKRF